MSSERRVASERSLTQAMRAMQSRLWETLPTQPRSASDLYSEFGRTLRRAILDGVLANGDYQIGKLLRLSSDGKLGVVTLTGGPKDFNRLTSAAQIEDRFVRDDGAVIHFSLTLRETQASPIELIAYSFEVYFPSKEPIEFIRFDLNKKGHDNADIGLRSHLHPGHEDLQMPSPLLSPVDALGFLLYRCRLRRDTPRD